MVYPVVRYGCESWTIRKVEHWRIDAFELWCWRRFLSPLDCKEIQAVYSKRSQSWIFIGRTDAESETPAFWPPDVKNWLTDAGKDWRQEEKGTTEDETVEWHHWHNGHGFRWNPGVDDGQWGLEYCSSWGRKESDTTEQLNWTDWNCRLWARLNMLPVLQMRFYSNTVSPIPSFLYHLWLPVHYDRRVAELQSCDRDCMSKKLKIFILHPFTESLQTGAVIGSSLLFN